MDSEPEHPLEPRLHHQVRHHQAVPHAGPRDIRQCQGPDLDDTQEIRRSHDNQSQKIVNDTTGILNFILSLTIIGRA